MTLVKPIPPQLITLFYLLNAARYELVQLSSISSSSLHGSFRARATVSIPRVASITLTIELFGWRIDIANVLDRQGIFRIHLLEPCRNACLGETLSILADGEIFLAFITSEDKW
jgi:hypothetical protein